MIQNQSRADTIVAVTFPVCIGIGTGIGALTHNVGVGIAIGAGIGTVLGLIGHYLIKSITGQEDQKM